MRARLAVLAGAAALAAGGGRAQELDRPWLDLDRPLAARVAALVSRMTLDEKVAQMMDEAPAIDRLGVPAYNWWNEALHGVARAGVATVFPQAIALAATFDEALVERVAGAIGDEARAKHHEFVRQGSRARYQGLTFFSPNINIVRDPRWGRGHETYGEDPFLSGRMATAFVRGLQGDHPVYLKAIATAKHFAVHSGPEIERHRFDARPGRRDLFDTYLPHFEAAVRDGRAGSIMTAYNAVDGVPASASRALVDDLLRGRWAFDGFVVSDCGAIADIWRTHRAAPDAASASALAVRAGTDLECGTEFRALPDAVRRGLVTDAEITRAVTRLFTARFRLGMFDPPERVPFAAIPPAVNDAPAHHALARDAARRSLVLLENDGSLPISPASRRLAVIGPTADSVDALVGNYNGTPSDPITILRGVREAASARGVAVTPAPGSEVSSGTIAQRRFAVEAARRSDLVVLVLGLTPKQEGEEGEDPGNPGGDRRAIELPAAQSLLFDEVAAVGRPVVVVLTGGGAQAIPDVRRRAAAVLAAWYPGGDGGAAVADVLFGDASPAGRLPVTFYASTGDLPDFADYSMRQRTYRYFRGEPLWAFGHGLGYSTFRYTSLDIAPGAAPASIVVSVEVTNSGRRSGDEVVQVYVTDEDAPEPRPLRSLVAFRRVGIAAGATVREAFTIPVDALAIVDEQGERRLDPGWFMIAAGGRQPGRSGAYRGPEEGLTVRFEIPRP
jgi:beta-glucosidase